MAEGVLGDVLGGGGDDNAASVRVGAEALAAAIATRLSTSDPSVARDTSAFLQEQTALLKAQQKSVEAEHDYFRLEWRPRLLGVQLRTAVLIFITLLAASIGAGLLVVAHDVFTSRRVVIDPFEVAPSIAARVPSGKIVASGLHDELSRLQDATRSSVQRLDPSSPWANQVQLNATKDGLSPGELVRLLKERFGHDVYVDGDLVDTPTGGLSLTVRGQGVPPKAFAGGVNDLAKLTTTAAEYVYSKSQPARWAYYLQNSARNEEAIAFCRTTVGRASKEDQPYLLNVWANSINNTGGSLREALALYRAALKVKPDYWVGYNNVMNTLWALGDEEGAWRAGEDMRAAAGGRPGHAPEAQYQNWDTLTWNLGPWLEADIADAEASAAVGTPSATSGAAIADIQARLHDPEAADLALKTTNDNPNDPTIAALTHFVRGRLAAEAGGATRAAMEMEAFGIAFADPNVYTNYPGYNCWIAPAEEAAGHPDKADAVLKTTGTFVDCYRFRGDILDSRGDWAGAQKAYANAVSLAPDLPGPYYSWGMALVRHGDPDGAMAKLKDANRHGPHWADPLKAWGDLLTKQGHAKDALGKYDEALKYAPNWAALKDARATAAKRPS